MYVLVDDDLLLQLVLGDHFIAATSMKPHLTSFSTFDSGLIHLFHYGATVLRSVPIDYFAPKVALKSCIYIWSHRLRASFKWNQLYNRRAKLRHKHTCDRWSGTFYRLHNYRISQDA